MGGNEKNEHKSLQAQTHDKIASTQKLLLISVQLF
jgi:hypothetical protein